jgi:5-methylcytosine-specific restriction endonuclease McrA
MPNKYGSRWIRPEKRLAIYLRDDWRCLYCGKSLKYREPKYRHLDHIVPREQGGTNHATNLATCCKSCNELKGDRDIAEFLRRKPHILQFLTTQVRKPLPLAWAKMILLGVCDKSGRIIA